MTQQTTVPAPAEELNPFEIAQAQFETAADYLDLDHSMRQVLKNAKRQLIVSIPVKMDSGEVRSSRAIASSTTSRAGPPRAASASTPASRSTR